jgi:hypothetical protein
MYTCVKLKMFGRIPQETDNNQSIPIPFSCDPYRSTGILINQYLDQIGIDIAAVYVYGRLRKEA